MKLDQESIVHTLFSARIRLQSAVMLVVRDSAAAEDIFQNVSVKALTRGAEFDTEGHLLSWAHVTARREAIDWLRREGRAALRVDDEVLNLIEAEGAELPIHGAARIDALRDCIEEAPEESRRMLELRYFDGRDCANVAKSLRLSVDAVYQRLSRLHRQLRHCIERRMNGDSPLMAS